MNWQDISTAPQDGTEVLCWREDCGPFIAKYTSVDSFPLTQAEIDAMDEESLFHKDWFTQWPQAFRLDGSEAPTHWMPLPAAPGEKCRTCSGHGAVGNILTAEPCPDCTPGPAPAAPGVVEALDRMDALLDPANGLLTVSGTSATVVASRADMALIRATLAAKESP